MTWSEMLRELLRSFPGKAGVTMLFILLALSVVALVRFPLDFGEQRWSNPAIWADNPKVVPPSWTNLLPGSNKVRHTTLEATTPDQVEAVGAGEVHTYRMSLSFDYDEPPTFVALSIEGVTYQERPPTLTMTLARPDGSEVTLFREVVRGPRGGEAEPFLRFHEEPRRVTLSADQAAVDAMVDFYRDEYGADLSRSTIRASMVRALFGGPDAAAPEGIRLLRGDYEVRLRASFADSRDSLEQVGMVVGGSVFGLMGTDSVGRDLAQGLLFGLPVALFIGITAALVTTAIGASLGVISGYVGGRTDLLIQRLADIVANVPLLPLLIFFVFIVGSNLYLIILFLVAFSWPGLTILLRSMVLQIRSGQLVESAITVGASKWRIMYRHIFPQMAPFVFAQMIFFVPAAILAEAGLSFLGLGDPSIPTWGQILESGFRTGAVYLGFWWWVIPPGVLIIITAVTFMFLALGMEPVVNPRLRRVR
jgi:peptide/nickel transport system permease protein